MSDVDFYRPTLKEIEGDEPFNDAEKRVIEDMREGWVLFSDTLPGEDPEAPSIRGPLIRHLMLGGCEEARVSRAGVHIEGARITGELSLRDTVCEIYLSLHKCRFDQKPWFRDAKLKALYLDGCHMPGLNGQRLCIEQSVHLRNDFHSTETVDLIGATIGGGLDCSGGTFNGKREISLDLSASKIGADLFLNDGFSAQGTVDIVGTQIAGQLTCKAGKFDGNGGQAINAEAATIGTDVFLPNGFSARGKVDFRSTNITGDLDCRRASFADTEGKGGKPIKGGLDCESATIGGTFDFQNLKLFSGYLDLTAAQVGRLRDDKNAYKDADLLLLTGFRYDRLDGEMTVGQRLKWLESKKERPIREDAKGFRLKFHFAPQPYSHLARIYREQGSPSSAARILEARDNRLWKAGFWSAMLTTEWDWRTRYAFVVALFRLPFMWLFRMMFGYGHLPGRAIWWVLSIWGLTAFLFGHIFDLCQMAPASDKILTSPDWITAVQTSTHPLGLWLQSETAQDYATFNPLIYAADLFVPRDHRGGGGCVLPQS